MDKFGQTSSCMGPSFRDEISFTTTCLNIKVMLTPFCLHCICEFYFLYTYTNAVNFRHYKPCKINRVAMT